MASDLQSFWRRKLQGLGFHVMHIYNETDINEAVLFMHKITEE